MPMNKQEKLKHQITDTAIELAEKTSWESIRLNDVADNMGITLNEIREVFSEKEEIIDAWFDRADSSMLKTSETAEFDSLETRKKLHMLLINWLAALSAHRKVTRQMILGKLEFGHLHYQVDGLLRISRTVQWWRDAAGISSTLPERAIDETILTAVYLSTFIKWMNDSTENSISTSKFLQHRLDFLARMQQRFASAIGPQRQTTSPPPASN